MSAATNAAAVPGVRPLPKHARRVHAFGLCTKTCEHEEAAAVQIGVCRAWIRRWAYRRKSINARRGSYSLKHDVENSVRTPGSEDVYVTNGAFIVAALLEGYTVVACSADSLNAFFNIGIRKAPLPIVEVGA